MYAVSITNIFFPFSHFLEVLTFITYALRETVTLSFI